MKTTRTERGWLNLFFDNIDFTNIGNAGGLLKSTADGSLYISLHTAIPALGSGTEIQTSNEAAYTGYLTRPGVSRTGGWDIVTTGDPVTYMKNAAAITFPKNTGSAEQEWFVGIGELATTGGHLWYVVPLGTPLGQGVVDDSDEADVVILPEHTLSADDRVCVFDEPDGDLDTISGSAANGAKVLYAHTIVADRSFKLSEASGGGTPITFSGDARFQVYKMSGLNVATNVTPEIAADGLKIYEGGSVQNLT
jgi:hypothetical protein